MYTYMCRGDEWSFKLHLTTFHLISCVLQSRVSDLAVFNSYARLVVSSFPLSCLEDSIQVSSLSFKFIWQGLGSLKVTIICLIL